MFCFAFWFGDFLRDIFFCRVRLSLPPLQIISQDAGGIICGLCIPSCCEENKRNPEVCFHSQPFLNPKDISSQGRGVQWPLERWPGGASHQNQDLFVFAFV